MARLNISMTAATLLVSLASTPAVAQKINILGSGRGWKLQPQRGPEGQNVYSYDCAADFGRILHHRVSHAARHTRTAGR